MVIELIPSPALIPARASIPPNPLVPPEASPVVHCMSVYTNVTKDSLLLNDSMHWNVLFYWKNKQMNRC